MARVQAARKAPKAPRSARRRPPSLLRCQEDPPLPPRQLLCARSEGPGGTNICCASFQRLVRELQQLQGGSAFAGSAGHRLQEATSLLLSSARRHQPVRHPRQARHHLPPSHLARRLAPLDASASRDRLNLAPDCSLGKGSSRSGSHGVVFSRRKNSGSYRCAHRGFF